MSSDAGFEFADGNLAPEPTINFDWNSFAPTTWSGTAPYRTSAKTVSGWSFVGIEDAAAANSDTAFAGGTKQDDDCATVGTGKAPNKDDMDRVYLTTKTVNNNVFLGLAWERITQNTTSPSAHIGFEFNKGTTPCGAGSNGLVQRTVGDMLFVYDFEGGDDVPVISLRRWVSSGACEVGSNSPPCWGPSQNLTLLGYAEAKVNTTGAVTDSIEPNAPQQVGTKEFGEAGVNLTAAGVFSSSVCENFGKAYAVSRSSGNSAQAQMKDLVGPAAFTISNCGSITIVKVTDPSPDPTDQSFAFTLTGGPSSLNKSFSLKNGESNTTSGLLVGSGYSAEETVPTGWDLTSATCDNGDAITNITVTVNQTVTCTFTNRARGTIIVEKITDDGYGSFDFTSNTLGTPAPFSFTLTTTAAGVGGKDSDTFADLTPGSYDVAETVPAGWNFVSGECDDGSDPASIGLSAGETVTCTFHNERERGALLIKKERKHAAAEGGIDAHAGVTFTVTGGELADEGVTDDTDASGYACVEDLVVSSLVGTYDVKETVPAGYLLDGSITDPQTGIAVVESTCAERLAETPIVHDAYFLNIPLTNVTVSVDSQIDGGTASTIECVDETPATVASGSTGANGDGSATANDLLPGTYTCTVVIDP